MWVRFLRSFPGSEAHEVLFLGDPKWRVLGGIQKVYVENLYVLFPSPTSEVILRVRKSHAWTITNLGPNF